MLQQYFTTTAWVPQNSGTNNFYTANLGNGIVAIGYKSQPVLVQPGQTDKLEEHAVGRPGDSGTKWLPSRRTGSDRRLRLAVVHLPTAVQAAEVHPQLPRQLGFSIIVITFIVRGIMYPLTKAQYTSMAKMRMLQPKIQAMRERLGDDKQRQSRR